MLCNGEQMDRMRDKIVTLGGARSRDLSESINWDLLLTQYIYSRTLIL